MAQTETQGMKGRLTLVLRDAHGREVERREVDNLITDAGRNLVARFFTGTMQVVPRLTIAVGTGNVAPAVTDTDLNARVAAAEATVQVNGRVAVVRATLPPSGTGAAQALQEAGIRIELGNLAPVLYNRVTFPVVNKGPNMEMTLSWEVTF